VAEIAGSKPAAEAPSSRVLRRVMMFSSTKAAV
jgi:hypothetical protein